MAPPTESLWHGTHQLRRFPPLSRPLEVDVAVIGGGITGVTAAVLMARDGKSVALIERDRVASGETGLTTSHLTEAIDARFSSLRKAFGEQSARLAAESSRAAIDRIEQFVRELSIDCDFARIPGYLYSEREDEVRGLANELDAAVRAGGTAEWVDHVPLPFATVGGVCWQNQAQLHATAYLAGLVEEAVSRGVRIFEETRVTNVHDADGSASSGGWCIVHTDRFDLRAKDVFVASHVPINNRVLLQTKIAAYRTYAMAFDVTGASPLGEPALFWDTESPYHYTRVHAVAGRAFLIVGGEDHRTGGEDDTEVHFSRVESYVEARYGRLPQRYRWSGQVLESVDGLPFIGLNSGESHVYVATGYSGNGMTHGTAAAMIVSDRIAGRENPYTRLFEATRVKPLAAAKDYVAENVGFVPKLARDRLTSHDVDPRSPEALAAGDGAIFNGSDGKLAICRDQRGELHACSAVCTHLGCDVAWNGAEQTWDCPCHGSRFSPEGKVINGPAVIDLAPARVPTPR